MRYLLSPALLTVDVAFRSGLQMFWNTRLMVEQNRVHLGATQRQLELRDHQDRFGRFSSAAAGFLQFLRRSNVGIWRVEPDPTKSRWWLNVTLPANHQEVFGLNREIQVFYTEYEHVEPRTLSLIQTRVRREMRVEPDVAILVSRDKQVKHAAARRRGEMAIIPIDLDEIQSDTAKPLHALIAESVATTDHYDVSTPVRDPSGFYGRHAEIETIANDLRRAVSVGVFGLRKAGKTSLLNSIAALRADDDRNITVRIDVSEIDNAEQFRSLILEGLWSAIRDLGTVSPMPRARTLNKQGIRRVDLVDSASLWIQDIRALLENVSTPAVLIVDEIDQAYPPRSNLAAEEAQGLFRSLVQLRSVLQEQDRLALLCAGVDPALFERPLLEGRDNLLYKLVRLLWLAPMNREEMAEMVRSLGKRMGVRVRDFHVINLLYETYGGHPLLTRKACSFAVRGRAPETLPFHLTEEVLLPSIASSEYGGPRDQAADVVDSFTEWFPAEAALLRSYFSNDQDEREFAHLLLEEEPEALLHSVTYGLCFPDHSPRIAAAIDSLRA